MEPLTTQIAKLGHFTRPPSKETLDLAESVGTMLSIEHSVLKLYIDDYGSADLFWSGLNLTATLDAEEDFVCIHIKGQPIMVVELVNDDKASEAIKIIQQTIDQKIKKLS